jgi:type I restriction enzyme S subunit
LGVVHFVHEDFWPLNTSLWVREFKRVSPVYAFFLLQNLKLDQFNGGASVPTLDRKAVHRLPVLIPNKQLSKVFGDSVSPIFAMIQKLVLRNQKLKQARDLLLPRLMNGELTVDV